MHMGAGAVAGASHAGNKLATFHALAYARQVNPGIRVFELSARSGEGLAAWLDWLRAGCAAAAAPSDGGCHGS